MATMRVILTEEVPKLGAAGDVVSVKAGYGRNYLLPTGKAMLATESRVRQVEHQRRVIEEKERKRVGGLQELAKSVAGVDLTFEALAGDEGKLFGSVTNVDIAGRLAEQGFDVERRKVLLREPIKRVGEHEVTIRLHRDVQFPVQVVVVAADAPEPEPVDDFVDPDDLPSTEEDDA